MQITVGKFCHKDNADVGPLLHMEKIGYSSISQQPIKFVLLPTIACIRIHLHTMQANNICCKERETACSLKIELNP